MKNLLNSKWKYVMILSLVTVLLLGVTIGVYAKNVRFNEREKVNAVVSKTGKIAGEVAYDSMLKKGPAVETIDAVVEVAASADPAETTEAATEAAVTEEVPTAADETAAVITEEVQVVSYEETYTPAAASYSAYDITTPYDVYYTAGDLRFYGVIYAGSWRWTWYSQNVLPGGGLSIPGRHVDESGYVCDENDRICLASNDLAYGTVVETPFGKQGCVYDCGCDYGTLDVYVDF